MIASIIGAFGVPGENDKSRRVVELCAERRLCVGNTFFEYMNLHKYTKGQDGKKVKSMIDLVLVKKDMLNYMQDISGMG